MARCHYAIYIQNKTRWVCCIHILTLKLHYVILGVYGGALDHAIFQEINIF